MQLPGIPVFVDTETIGFHGPIVLIQHARGDEEIKLHNVWYEPIFETLNLIKSFCSGVFVGFNLAFDWFHLCQTYTTLCELAKRLGDVTAFPIDHIETYALCEPDARFGKCLKPEYPCDLYGHVCKGELQSLMDRDDIIIKRVPTVLSEPLAYELTKRVKVPDIYFANRKDQTRWKIDDITDDLGEVDPDFKNLKLGFDPSRRLKVLATELLGFKGEDVLHFEDVKINCPKVTEIGYAPFALAHAEKRASGGYQWNGAWPDYIKIHADHWQYNKLAREYGTDDIVYTRALYKYLGEPEAGDNDSVLACAVGACRWRGYAIDVPKLRELRLRAIENKAKSPHDFGSPAVCKLYLQELMSPIEKMAMMVNGKETTGKIILNNIAAWTVSDTCPDCQGLGESLETGEKCETCHGEGLIKTKEVHPVAKRAREIMDFRRACKEIDLYDKLIKAGRFHASFKIIGTRSGRMAGADDLNAQGIDHSPATRGCFTLADDGFTLCGGDFSSFEMTIQDAAYHDPKMHDEIKASMDSGFKFHAAWGHRYFFPHMSYEEIVKSGKTATNPMDNYYTRCKQGVFAICYFGEAFTLVSRVGIPPEQAEWAYRAILADYSDFAEARKEAVKHLVAMSQPDGLGTKVVWQEPANYVESLLGFKRFFTLENAIMKTLFELAEDVPEEWTKLKMKVTRRDREQTVAGATRSALFGAAFAIQSSNMRAGGNHRIQSTGAELTKILQRLLWNQQPVGISDWRILLLNIHDELMTPMKPEIIEESERIVEEFVEKYKELVPLLRIEWSKELKSWAEKA